MSKPKVLELFAGSCTFSKEAERLGCETFRSDYKEFDGINYAVDILNFDVKKVPFKPDLIWASPPCTSFSVASIFRHWNKNNTPKSEKAVLGVKYVEKTLEIIYSLKPKFWYMENPRGKLRVLDVVKGLPRVTVWYCQYGEQVAKPTDIWSNNIYNPLFNNNGWKPKAECFNGNINCHHDKQPRGYKAKKESGALGKGIQGRKDNYQRSILPVELCREILLSSKL
jgi:hypothetical protein